MSFYEQLTGICAPLGINVAYGSFREDSKLPCLIYLGDGAQNAVADNQVYHSAPDWRLEYYYSLKDEEKEQAFEQALTDGGFIWGKGGDTYISDEAIFVIYYDL